MLQGVESVFADKSVQLGAIVTVTILAVIGLVVWLRRKRPTAEELERQRRLEVTRFGRMADGTVIEIHDHIIEYSYSVRGIGYSAWQDLHALEELLPGDKHRLIGSVNLKYMQQNPANSIVLSEEWCGLRYAGQVSQASQ
jgi:hypothetical protein